MAVAVVMDFEGATLDQYDQILQKMGLSPGGATPPGAISHWVAATEGGIHVTDVWESRERYDEFANEQIGPYSQEVGITTPPRIEFYDVHSYLTKT